MKKIIILLFLLLPFYIHAQELVTTAGGEGGGVIWSVGEAVTATITNAGESFSLTQGFLQPEHTSPTAINLPRHDYLQLQVYPNPVTDRLFIQVEEALHSWKIHDSTGRTLSAGQFSGREQSIDFSNYRPGYYILTVASPEGIQSIKIIK
jgi:hypothetical protein